MDMAYEFEESLKAGQEGEELFLQKFPKKLVRTAGRTEDFIDPITKDRIELKTDKHDEHKTDNFFVEMYSNVDLQTLGGAPVAKKRGCNKFYYFFINSGNVYMFNIDDYIAKCSEYFTLHNGEKEFEEVLVPNIGYFTSGRKMKRDFFKDVYTKINIFDNVELDCCFDTMLVNA